MKARKIKLFTLHQDADGNWTDKRFITLKEIVRLARKRRKLAART